jgi:AraC family transcriptional regulator
VNRASRLEYVRRVNRVIDHVRDHLGEALSLATLARLAAFSPFHFHRVFRAVTGETVFAFIQRLRIERAANVLRNDADRSVLEVALDHGFGSAATFARAFRARFGTTATAWRATEARQERKSGKPIRKGRKASKGRRADTRRRTGKEAAMNMNVQVRQAPPYHVAYMRYVGPYGPHGIPELWMKLRTWIDAHGLGTEDTVTLGVAHDDPSITAPEQCQYDACVVVPGDFVADRSVNLMDVVGGRCAVAQFEGTAHEIQGAWDRVFSAWLPGSGYQPDDRPCYELYRGNPMKGSSAGAFRCELHLPVRPL